MSKKHQNPGEVIEQTISKSEQFIEHNRKKLLIALLSIVALVGIVFGYNNFYRVPFMESATTSMYHAQAVFQRDSFADALNGVDGQYGFLSIIEDFSGTPQSNIANHYAGICYLNLGDYQKAIDYLTQYETVTGALADVVSAQNLGLTGDAYAELGSLDKAIQYYVDASNFSDNTDTRPAYLYKAALLNLKESNYDAAVSQFKIIKREYPRSPQYSSVDKYISYAEQKAFGIKTIDNK